MTGTLPEPTTLTQVKELLLSENSFSGTISNNILWMRNLEKLEMYSNNFTGSLPKGFANLKHVTQLQLAGNQFTGFVPVLINSMENLSK